MDRKLGTIKSKNESFTNKEIPIRMMELEIIIKARVISQYWNTSVHTPSQTMRIEIKINQNWLLAILGVNFFQKQSLLKSIN